MQRRLWIWMLAGLLVLAGAWWFWHPAAKPPLQPSAAAPTAAPAPPPAVTAKILTPAYVNSPKSGAVFAGTNKFALRLSNTTRTIGQLAGDRHAVLLANALIDTGSPLDFSLPAHLRSQGDPGAYIVQARGPLDAGFRAMLAASGAAI